MAGIHNALRRGGLSVALSAAIGDTRQGGLERYGETLTPVVDLWSQPEFAYLRGDNFGALFVSSAAVALEFSFAALTTSLTSKLLLIIDGITARGGGGQAFLGLSSDAVVFATGTVGAAPINRDQRYRQDPAFFSQALPVRSINGSDPTNTFAFTPALEEIIITGGAYAAFQAPPLLVKPGGAVVVVSQTVNQSIQVNWKFRTRTMYNTELSLAAT